MSQWDITIEAEYIERDSRGNVHFIQKNAQDRPEVLAILFSQAKAEFQKKEWRNDGGTDSTSAVDGR
jgi:hypothetical protein